MSSLLKKRCAGLILVFFIFLISISTPFRLFASFPDELRLFAGQSRLLNLEMPVSAEVMVENPEIVGVNGQIGKSIHVPLDRPVTVQSGHAGETMMKLKLFGKIPLKTLKVNVVPDLKVVPGGQTIGVKIKSDGILVVGHHLVQTAPDEKISPGQQADIRLGDVLTMMNGKKIRAVAEVSEIVQKAGKAGEPIEIVLLRGGQKVKASVKPALDLNENIYRLGIYIRDSAAGVGTLTFYAPDHGVYGALGHIITDMDTRTPIKPRSGEVVQSSVSSISKSQSGDPGEKRAHFFKEHIVMGNIRKNTEFGIFGDMHRPPEHGAMKEAIPVAFAEEVKEGPAEILTVLEGQKVERFQIEIVHAAKQSGPATKGLIIRITDPKLLAMTGGIVQGMSGSPILQDGKLVGAVTHVFVNDPTSGYGCYIEWMLQDAGILLKPTSFENHLKAG